MMLGSVGEMVTGFTSAWATRGAACAAAISAADRPTELNNPSAAASPPLTPMTFMTKSRRLISPDL